MIVDRAEPADIPRLLKFRTDAAKWLRDQGSDQWSTPYPPELLTESVTAGEVYLFRPAEAAPPVATVTLDRRAEPVLWSADERCEPSLYVHKLTLARPGSGDRLGARILDWCGDRAARSGMKWLRLDAWTSNTRLHAYYERLGFTHIRTVHDPAAYESGWVAQRPAMRCELPFQLQPAGENQAPGDHAS
ncbi:GNAT family N-acetyltransferase [Streptomyces sp. NBC_01142]|uniref:GNAT family N-acetyltransferase n=1 Tax=Streptomyces sp. NBC_01142 TaxID=2975865 RepID=UPI002251D7DB|nr:GNAT family N-acetyltransferase [Streptomyces sp. NBC_01142]MCX4826521.1 GNAT family N-acetyltransferase [Streptomyces sp. NBC_01142]